MRLIFTFTGLILLALGCGHIIHKSSKVSPPVIDNNAICNSFFQVYELSPMTVAMTVNLGESKSYEAFDSIFNELSVSDSLNYSMFGDPKNCSYYDTLGEYQLLKSDKFET
jgi:hypothetical protein